MKKNKEQREYFKVKGTYHKYTIEQIQSVIDSAEELWNYHMMSTDELNRIKSYFEIVIEPKEKKAYYQWVSKRNGLLRDYVYTEDDIDTNVYTKFGDPIYLD